MGTTRSNSTHTTTGSKPYSTGSKPYSAPAARHSAAAWNASAARNASPVRKGRSLQARPSGRTSSFDTPAAEPPHAAPKVLRSAATFLAVFAGLCAPWWVPPSVRWALGRNRPRSESEWLSLVDRAARAGSAGIPVLIEALGSGHRPVVIRSEAALVDHLTTARRRSTDNARKLNAFIAAELARRAPRWDESGRDAAWRIAGRLLEGPLPTDSNDITRYLAECDRLLRFHAAARFSSTAERIARRLERQRQADRERPPAGGKERFEDGGTGPGRASEPVPQVTAPPLPGGGLTVQPQQVPTLPPSVPVPPTTLPSTDRAPQLLRPGVKPPRELSPIASARKLPKRPRRTPPSRRQPASSSPSEGSGSARGVPRG